MFMGLPVGPASSKARMDLLTCIQLCGLTSGLKMCLDAGDEASYTSGQKWLDVSGNGYDFFRGADATVTTDDPTFNGTVGARSINEFWSVDGGDYFTYDTTNETWMQNLHKTGAKFSILSETLGVTATPHQHYFSTTKNVFATVGILFGAYSQIAPGIVVFNNTGGTAKSAFATANAVTVSASVVVLNHYSRDDAAAQISAVTNDDNSLDTVNRGVSGAYASPSAASASFTAKIGWGGDDAGGIAVNGCKFYSEAIWEGVFIELPAELALFNCRRGKYSR